MNQRFAVAMQLVVASALAACATPTPISGNTRAGEMLKADTSRFVSMLAKVETKCDQIDSIETQLIKVNPVGTGNTAGAKRYGSTEERWVINLCNQSIPYAVTFTPDGQGGTFFATSREKK